MTTTQININSAAYRADQRQPRPTVAQQVAHLERYLAERAEFSWTAAYRQAEQQLAALTGGA